MACATHGACASRSGPGTYCARGANGVTSCAACWECETFADAYDGACPATCDGDVRSAGTTFVENYAYWSGVESVSIEWSGVANSTTRGCRACAVARTSAHDGAKTWTSCGRAVGAMTRKDVARWCDVANVTAFATPSFATSGVTIDGRAARPGPARGGQQLLARPERLAWRQRRKGQRGERARARGRRGLGCSPRARERGPD